VPKSLVHKFVSAVADGADATVVRPSNWNADHNFWLGIRAVTITSDTIAHSDHLSLVTYNNASAIAVSLPAPTGGNMPLGWKTTLKNLGAGVATVTGTGGATVQLGGSANASYALNTGDTLEILSLGTAAYIGVLTQAPVTAAAVQFGGQLRYSSATALTFTPYKGSYLALNGAQRVIPSGGIAGLANTSVFVNGASGQNLAANTTYFVYAFDNAGTLTADFSTTGHATSVTAGNVGTEIQNGNDTRSLIGIIRTTAASQFADSVTQRFVRSWFNKQNVYLSNAYTASQSNSSTAMNEVNSQIRISMVVWATDVVLAQFGGNTYITGSAGGWIAIGWDGVATANRWTVASAPDAASGPGAYAGPLVVESRSLSEGYHYVTGNAAVLSGSSVVLGDATSFCFLTAEISP